MGVNHCCPVKVKETLTPKLHPDTIWKPTCLPEQTGRNRYKSDKYVGTSCPDETGRQDGDFMCRSQKKKVRYLFCIVAVIQYYQSVQGTQIFSPDTIDF